MLSGAPTVTRMRVDGVPGSLYDVRSMEERRLRIQSREGAHAEYPVLSLAGALVAETAAELQEALHAAVAQTVILDLGEVPIVDSTGIGSLVQAHRSWQKSGRRLVLVAPGRQLLTLLEITHIREVFLIFATMEEAERSLAAESRSDS